MDWNNKEEVLKEVKGNGCALEFTSDTLKDDFDVVMTAVKNDWRAFRWASEKLKDNKDLVMNYF